MSLMRATYAVALIGAVAWCALVIQAAAGSGTLGYDYRAYDLAVHRLLAGQEMYEISAEVVGGFGLFLYPPPFAVLIAPVALLPDEAGIWVWTLALVAATIAAVVAMPVSPRVQWLVLLMTALSWPALFAVKLGQVGPLVLLLFAVGWRWIDRPWTLGISGALGALIKLQPVIILGWALLTGRLRAALIGVACLFVLAVAATVVTGPGAWSDWLDVLGRLNKPVLTPHGVGLGRLLFEAGVPEVIATVAYWANLAAVVAVALFVTLRGTAVASYLAVAIVSHFVSPVLWEHYALVLLLPTAWLLQRGRWWAAVIPLATSNLFLLATPPATYWVVFWLALLAVTIEGVRERRGETLRAQGNTASSILAT